MITRERMTSLITAIRAIRAQLDDATALDVVGLYPAWAADHDYSVGDRVCDDGILYKCVQAHTSQSNWRLSLTPALWARVSVDEWPEWIQPTGVQDAYNTGDKVSHNDKHWVSIADSNVWEPGVYGWEEA